MAEYQVIARKWRPQRFSDVVGQEHVVRTLRNAIIGNRIAHAYLFVGPRGVGKTTLARIFGKAMNCLNPQNGEPCCQCSSCLDIAAERSLDLLEVDAASRNSTTDMRDLAEDVMTRPVGGRYKIYIIDEVHMLSKPAWNVLLKTVEEPPPHVKFIFATTEVHQVLPTIISRCQRFDLLPIATGLIAERLRLIADTEKVAINAEAIDAIARAADGGMRDAQSLLDQMIAFFAKGDGSEITGEQVLSLFGLTDRRDLDMLMIAMLGNEPGKAVEVIGSLARRGKNLETLYDDLLAALRAVQLVSLLPDPSELIGEGADGIARYRKLAAITAPENVQIMLEVLSPVGRILHDALNKQIYLETLLLKAMREAHAVRLDAVLARLNQLRQAGELKFLNEVPPAEPTRIVFVNAPAPAAVEAAPARNSAPADEPEAVESPSSEVRSEPADADANDETDMPPDGTAANKASETYDDISPESESESDADSSDETTPDEAPPVAATQNQPAAAAASEPVISPETGGRARHSIANDNPAALREALNDPYIHDAAELFGGQVIDIHR